jgi:hypothetical protein
MVGRKRPFKSLVEVSDAACCLAVSYAVHPNQVELWVDRRLILCGEFRCRTSCDGRPVEIAGEWEQACWQTDAKCDYLELALPLSHGLRLERQILLAHRDRLLYAADMILSSDGSPRSLSHQLELPLAEGVTWRSEDQTRDGLLKCGKRSFAVLPLGLKEWRADPRGGRLDTDNSMLALSMEATGQAICCPLLIDLDRERSLEERTWRQLTVGESLQIVPCDAAVGYRAQSGADQWLFYRSLGPTGNRTVLGQNIAGEFYAGRLKPSGKFVEWIEIEPFE